MEIPLHTAVEPSHLQGDIAHPEDAMHICSSRPFVLALRHLFWTLDDPFSTLSRGQRATKCEAVGSQTQCPVQPTTIL